MKPLVEKILISAISGIIGSGLTIAYSALFEKPTSFTVLIDNNEVKVTQSDYTALLLENKELKDREGRLNDDLKSTQLQLDEENSSITDKEKLILELQGEISSLQNELNQQKDNNIDDVITNATSYWKEGNYIQSLTLLKVHQTESELIATLYKKYSEDYVSILIEQANIYISEKDYDGAKVLLNNGKKLVENYTILDEKLDELDSLKETKLSNIKINNQRYFSKLENGRKEDTIGNIYLSDNMFIITGKGINDYGFGIFHLGEKYGVLKGTIAYSDESHKSDNVLYEGSIEIHIKDANGAEKSIYNSGILSRSSEPVVLPDLNISEAVWLEIRYYNVDSYYYDDSPRIILSDFTLYPE